MARSLGLATYRALNWRKAQPQLGPSAERPGGELLWVHATSGDRFAALCDFAMRMKGQRPGLKVLVTMNQDRSDTQDRRGCDHVQPLVSDHPVATRHFLDQWKPDMGIWTGGDLMPNLIAQASEAGIPMVLADIALDEVPTRRHRWLPDVARETIDRFDTILTRDAAAAASIRRAGVASDKIGVEARLRAGAVPPPCRDKDLAAASREFGGRPTWLAAAVQAGEMETILTAHRNALRLVHRLLLVVALADPGDHSAFKALAQGAGLRLADWDAGDIVTEDTQVIASTEVADLGLWYRMAPLTFVASTFERGRAGRNPLEAAALGSAVLHGPNTRDFRDAFASLTAAGAAEEVRDAEHLSAAVVRLTAPDQAARMALAGWQVATEGAHVIDRLIELVQDNLDQRESARAGA